MVTRIEKFGASWCGPCKVLDRTLEQISGIEIVKHDVDEEEELTNSKGIRNVPVLIYYNDRDEEVRRTVGAVSLGTIMQIVNDN
jgi:thiol-disulfide isomerase/thioredoxin